MSLKAWAIFAAMALVLPASKAFAEPSTRAEHPEDQSDEMERLILLAPGRPLRVDLAISVDGQPLRQAWRTRLQELAGDAEHDPDGRLTVDSAARLCEMAAGEFGLEPPRARVTEQLKSLADKDGKVSRDAVLKYIGQIAPPFQIGSGIAPGSVAAPALFGLIDRDHDGQLSRTELSGAATFLKVRDFDDDQLISERELIVDPTQHAERSSEENTQENSPMPAAETVLWMGPETTPQDIAARILRRYDRDGNGKLSPRGSPGELTLSKATVLQLDTNEDDQLDLQELQALAMQPAEIMLPLAFGSAGASRLSPVAPSSRSGELRLRKKIDGGYKVYLGDAQLDVNRNNRNPTQNNNAPELRFSRLDGDKNGYLDLMESKMSPIVAGAFTGMDTDNDAKIVPSEFQGYINGQNTSAASRVRLQVIDRGQDLFSVVDANGDGLLTPRELNEVLVILETEDRNGDGALSGLEIPARWSLDVARGSSRSLDARPMRLRVRTKQLTASDAGPLWFRKMDHNHDGDVTLREFLGSPADFDAADANHDGLIDASEAADVKKAD